MLMNILHAACCMLHTTQIDCQVLNILCDPAVVNKSKGLDILSGQCVKHALSMAAQHFVSKAPMVAGVLLYLLPLGAGQSKGGSSHGWGTPLHSFWCCYGSSVESFSKLSDSIYFFR